jgi:hypothetical protein
MNSEHAPAVVSNVDDLSSAGDSLWHVAEPPNYVIMPPENGLRN